MTAASTNMEIGLPLLIFFMQIMATLNYSSASKTSGFFDDDFYVTWSPDHANRVFGGRGVQIDLDTRSGTGFATKKSYMFGKFEAELKLPARNSAGTVVALYLYSNQPNRDEIDIEFLGNVESNKYIMQTNVFSDGHDDREQRVALWFDPAADFHTYTIFWNIYHIVFLVDGVPIREHRNRAVSGIPFPRRQPMSLYASIWNGENWATDGGRTKINWSFSPFSAQFRRLSIDACDWNGNPRFCRSDSTANWWNKRRFSALSAHDDLLLRWVRRHFLVYDYCADRARPKRYPNECAH
eukprot:TRINITY_DN30973_c0_g1_i1.p1 TRINITY_DN30973_c0_g1~~TRINITY_DN30973_c0_g1_i1.p1  ORF type:complete len:296 (+),score=-30.71 TRINITY_DN30973_c0_g1_i1:25-912(+)